MSFSAHPSRRSDFHSFASAARRFLRDIFVIPIATCGGVWYTKSVRTGWGEAEKGLVRKSDEKRKALYCRTVYVYTNDTGYS